MARGNGKFGNNKPVVDGIKFDSTAESARYVILREKEKLGLIKNLELQKKYDLVVNGLKICSYIADFVYEFGGRVVVEDVKGMVQATFKLKYKLMKACHDIEIFVTKAIYKGRLIVGFEKVTNLRLPKAIKESKKKKESKSNAKSRTSNKRT